MCSSRTSAPIAREKLGLTPEFLLGKHPRLIICSISGFGRTGPLKDAPGYDFAIQAMSGLMNITGPPDGPPYKVGVALADVLTGLYAATAILACLHARQSSGHGYAIDLAPARLCAGSAGQRRAGLSHERRGSRASGETRTCKSCPTSSSRRPMAISS